MELLGVVWLKKVHLFDEYIERLYELPFTSNPKYGIFLNKLTKHEYIDFLKWKEKVMDKIVPNSKISLYQSPLEYCQKKVEYLQVIIDGNKWQDDNYTVGLLERVYDDQQLEIDRLKKELVQSRNRNIALSGAIARVKFVFADLKNSLNPDGTVKDK